jgi:hypothetical protein
MMHTIRISAMCLGLLTGCVAVRPSVRIEPDSTVLFGVDARMVSDIAKVNGLQPWERWPVYQTTGYEHLPAPKCIADAFPIGSVERDLGSYRITSINQSGQRVHILYQPKAGILMIK